MKLRRNSSLSLSVPIYIYQPPFHSTPSNNLNGINASQKMATPSSLAHPSHLLLSMFVAMTHLCMASRSLTSISERPSNLLTYHNGALLKGSIPISILWYGKFTPTQKSIVSDFFLSLNKNSQPLQSKKSPSVAQWWGTIESLYLKFETRVLLSSQVSDEKWSMGKSLTTTDIDRLAAKAGAKKGGIAVVLTADDVAVEGFCISRCGSHGGNERTESAHIWVGNSAVQCPGQCAWPFHQPIYGPQVAALSAPNGDVGIDGMVINLASMVAGAVTNPFGNGFYQGSKAAPLEAATACPGVYGSGAYPGFAGELLVDPSNRGSYNAVGERGRKYLLPALFDPMTSHCSTLL